MPRKRGAEFPENGFEEWGGYMNAKISKLDEQFTERALREENKTSDIFAGISIFVNGYTNPSADQLKCLMSEHGGIYHHYFRTEKTKFIIASNLPDTKVKNLPSTKIVKPEWISDSIKQNTLLDYRDYLLYSNISKTQPRLNFKINDDSANDIVTSTNTAVNEATSSVSAGTSYAKTAKDENFLNEFYNNSRLHHISQLGSTFKQYINDLRSNSDFKFPLRESLRKISEKSAKPFTSYNTKVIMHIDMDCFFVSVGLRKHPHLKGQPIAVTHSKGTKGIKDNPSKTRELEMHKERRKLRIKKANPDIEIDDDDILAPRIHDSADSNDQYGSLSEIASCSYEARALGIKNGMFMGSALKLCPNLKTIPYDFDGYKEVAYTLYDTVAQYTLDIEAVSCDEMYVDCTSLLNDVKLSSLDFATVLREEIQKKTNCPCSTGFGENRLQARVATKRAKPNGQFHLIKEDVETYFANIPLGDLPGVGRQMQFKLKSLGFTTCQSLWSVNINYLKTRFGNKTGQLLHQNCRGQDSTVLNFNTVRKSISAGVNYGIRFTEVAECETFLKQLCQEIHSRMIQNKVIGKLLTLKLMVRADEAPVETAKFMGHGVCDNVNKSVNLKEATNSLEIIIKEILDINKKAKVKPEDLRGVCIQMSKLQSTEETKKCGIEKFMSKKTSSDEVNEKKNESNVEKLKVLGSTKRRGRPPKNSYINRTTVNNPIENFLGTKKNQIEEDEAEYDFSNIDKEVFEALPDDLKQEVLQSCKITKKKANDTEVTIPQSDEAADTEKDEEESLEFDILNLEWTDVKEMLQMWINSDSLPLECDVKLINMYLRNLVVLKKIEDTRYLLNFTYRVTNDSKLCEWHKVYSSMVNSVQESMILTYGKRMFINNKFTCCDNTGY